MTRARLTRVARGSPACSINLLSTLPLLLLLPAATREGEEENLDGNAVNEADWQGVQHSLIPPVGTRRAKLQWRPEPQQLPAGDHRLPHRCLSLDEEDRALSGLIEKVVAQEELLLLGEQWPQSAELTPDVRSHSGIRVREKDKKTGEIKTILVAQCTDTWHGKGARLDNVSVRYEGGDGQLLQAFAKLLLLFSWKRKGSQREPLQLALVHWYYPAKREGFRPVLISKHYLKQRKLSDEEATDVVEISAITSVAHIIQDRQAKVPVRVNDTYMPQRYFVNDGNKRCL